jgi:hypothetical protein
MISCNLFKEKKVCISNFSQNEMIHYLDKIELDTQNFSKMKDIGAFNEESCQRCYEIKEANFDSLLNNLKNSNLKTPSFHAIFSFSQSLFLISPEPLYPQNFSEDLSVFDEEEIYLKLINGNFSPMCHGISDVFSKLVETKSLGAIMSHELVFYNPKHVVNVVSFCEDNNQYILSVDIQNGILGPFYKSDSSLVLFNDMSKVAANDLMMLHFSDKVLKKKRNLCNEVFPCNFLPDATDQYFFIPNNESEYTLERQSYPINYYVWFVLNQVNEQEYLQTILHNMQKTQHIFNIPN